MAEDKKLSPLEALDKKHARETAERTAKIEAAANDLRAAEEMVREGEAQARRPPAREGHAPASPTTPRAPSSCAPATPKRLERRQSLSVTVVRF